LAQSVAGNTLGDSHLVIEADVSNVVAKKRSMSIKRPAVIIHWLPLEAVNLFIGFFGIFILWNISIRKINIIAINCLN